MSFKKIFKSKKGIAIETAILALVIAFSLCFLVMSLTVIGHHQSRIENTLILRDVELDQIGEDFISSVKNDVEFDVNAYQDRSLYCVVDGTSLVVSYDVEGSSVALEIEVEKDAYGNINIKKWQKKVL